MARDAAPSRGVLMRGLGSSFGSYNLEQVVMTDAVSVTFRATMARQLAAVYNRMPTRMSRPVLLRVTDPFEGEDADLRAEVFVERTRAAAKLEHPAMARLVDAGVLDGRVYVATRWTTGLTLEELLRREGRLDPHAACELLRPLAEALDALHTVGLAHAAVSPRSIWVDEEDGARTARFASLGLDTSLRDDVFEVVGEGAPSDAFYVAPEQVMAPTAAPSCDQYALACTLYHCVCGRPPFHSAAAAARFGTDDVPVFDFDDDEIPDEVRGAIALGMQLQPQLRYMNCTALLLAAQADSADAPGPAPAAHSNGNGTAPRREWLSSLLTPGADPPAMAVASAAHEHESPPDDGSTLPVGWPAAAVGALAVVIVVLVLVLALG